MSERADYFDVQHPFLLGALDRFAQFFLCPLFSESATEREMKAVDSENSKNLQSDAWRLQQLFKGAADPRHPWSRFNVGSIETLSDKLERYVRLELSTASVPATRGSAQPQPGAEGGGSAANVATASVHASVRAKHVPALKVRRTLIDFHSRHYSANLMTVAILGRECLDTLAQWAVPLFATVPDQKLPRPKFDVEPYPLSRLNNYYRIVPVKNFSSLTVTWALPPITEQVHSKPFRYVSHLLGHESEGSLLSLLKNKGWADQLMAGESRSHSDFACFDVTIELTDEADAHVDEIIGLIFAYIRLIAAEPEPHRWVFDEMRDLASVSFRFRDVVEPSSLVMALAASLQLHPPKLAHSHPYLYDEWRPDLISDLLMLMTPQRATVSHVSRVHESIATSRERWYGTMYQRTPISDALLAQWSAVPLHPELHFPTPNPFIPTDFALVCDSEVGKAEEAAAAQAEAAATAAATSAAHTAGNAPNAAAVALDVSRGLHPGVCCDRSGTGVPILGLRYHLKGKDYDLCQAEYDKLTDADKLLYEAIPPPHMPPPPPPCAQLLELTKPKPEDRLGLSFESWALYPYLGLVVDKVHKGFLIEASQLLAQGDVVHEIDGRAVSQPNEGAAVLRVAHGTIRLNVTRKADLPKVKEAAAAAVAAAKAGPTPPPPLVAVAAASDGSGAPCKVPRLIRSDGLAQLWHKTDRTFRRPKTSIMMDIASPHSYVSPEAACLTRLFFRLLQDELTEFVYPAECAGLHYSVYNSTSGLRLSVGGYNHKLPALLEKVLGRLATPTLDASRFQVQKDLQLKEYGNFFKGQPHALARYAASHLLEMSRWHMLEYIEYVGSDACSHASLAAFTPRLLERIYMNVLCHGNTSQAEAKALVEQAAEVLKSGPLRTSQRPMLRLLQLPADVEVVLRLHPSLYSDSERSLLNTADTNSAVEFTLQAGLDKRPDTITLELLVQILANPCYEQLRTKEQLGYIVNLGLRIDLGVTGLRVIVQSATHDAAHLDARIELFMAGVPMLLDQLTAEEFGNHRSALLTAKLEQPKTLRQESGIYWNEIAQGTYDFERDSKDAEVLRTLSKDEVIQFWGRHFDASTPGRRKLSAQSFAAHHALPSKLAAGVQQRPIHYIDGLEAVLEYKRTLAAYPPPLRCDKVWN